MSTILMTKTPEDVLDFDVDFSRWLADADRITNATATLSGSVAIITQVEFSEKVAKIWLSGGAATETAKVSVIITTAQGRTKEYCFPVRLKDCC